MNSRLVIPHLRGLSGILLERSLRFLAALGTTFLIEGSANAAVSLTDAQRDWLQQKSKLVFATDTNYPPYTFVGADGQARGLDVDVVRAVGQVLGVAVEFRAEIGRAHV